MIRDEEYTEFLKLIISCISKGDYFSFFKVKIEVKNKKVKKD